MRLLAQRVGEDAALGVLQSRREIACFFQRVNKLAEGLKEHLRKPLLFEQNPVFIVTREQRAAIQFDGSKEMMGLLRLAAGLLRGLKGGLKLRHVRCDGGGI